MELFFVLRKYSGGDPTYWNEGASKQTSGDNRATIISQCVPNWLTSLPLPIAAFSLIIVWYISILIWSIWLLTRTTGTIWWPKSNKSKHGWHLGLGCNSRQYSASYFSYHCSVFCVEVSCPRLYFENLCCGFLIRQLFCKRISVLCYRATNWLLNIEPINLLVGYRQDYYSIVKMSRKRCRYTTNFVLQVSSKWTSDQYTLVWKNVPSN